MPKPCYKHSGQTKPGTKCGTHINVKNIWKNLQPTRTVLEDQGFLFPFWNRTIQIKDNLVLSKEVKKIETQRKFFRLVKASLQVSNEWLRLF